MTNRQGSTFVLIPGAGGDAWYWHLVVPLLEQHGHEAIAVDLPASDDHAGLRQYADVVIRAIGKREREGIIVVAQSLGGFTAPLVCTDMPVALLVLVNAMIPKPGETPGEWWTNTGYAEAKRRQNLRDGRKPDAPFDPIADFFHDVPQSVVDSALARGEPRQSEKIFGSPCAFKTWPMVPTRVLVGRDDRFLPCELQRRIAQERLCLSVDEMPGGHLLALSQAAELSARLMAYIDG